MKILNISLGLEKIYTTKSQNKSVKTTYISPTLSTDSVSFSGQIDSLKNIYRVGNKYKNKIQIIFADIDGTISPKNDIVSEKTIESLEYLHEKGIPVILTTARCYRDTVPILDKMKYCADYVITLQGGEIVDKAGILITRNSIPHKTVTSLNNWYHSLKIKDDNIHLIIYIDNQPYATSNIDFPWKAATNVKQINTFDEIISKGNRIQKAILYKPNEQKGSDAADKIIRSFITSGINDLNLSISGTGFYEFQNKGVTKDKAIDLLLKKLNIMPNRVMVIGDSSNDIEMFDYISQRGGLAVAMGNATVETKNHSMAITSLIENDGFSKAISAIFD